MRGLAPRLLGRRIVEIEVRQRRVAIGDLSRAAGFVIAAVRRRGKHIVFDLRRGSRFAHLVIHLGMTGQLRLDAEPGRHTHAILQLEGGTALLYNDIRQFGRLEFCQRLPERFERLGAEPLDITEEEFVQRLRVRRSMVKPLLLDQSFVSGLGNIYADEALFRAGIHPRAVAARLRSERARRLYRSIVEVLEESIRLGGSSVSDYVASDGRRGRFQLRHQVYRRTGRPCPVCGTPIRRILVASRGTHFCPKCQRPPAQC